MLSWLHTHKRRKCQHSFSIWIFRTFPSCSRIVLVCCELRWCYKQALKIYFILLSCRGATLYSQYMSFAASTCFLHPPNGASIEVEVTHLSLWLMLTFSDCVWRFLDTFVWYLCCTKVFCEFTCEYCKCSKWNVKYNIPPKSLVPSVHIFKSSAYGP